MTTVKEIKAELDRLGVDYKPSDLKPALERKLAGATISVPTAQVVGKKLEVKREEPEVKLPVFENRQVLKILATGHLKTHFHCLLEGGVTMHVPKSLF